MELSDATLLTLLTLSFVEIGVVAALTLLGMKVRRREKNLRNSGLCRDIKCTVLIATKDEDADMVKRTVLSALSSMHTARVVVVDDSRPENYAALRKVLEDLNNGKVVIVHRERNRGFKPGALNDGLRHAIGDFVIVADADTVLGDFPAAAAAAISEGYDVVQASTQPLTGDSSVAAAYFLIIAFRDKILLPGCAAANVPFIAGYGYGIKLKLIRELNGWNEKTLAEDLDLSLRLSLLPCKYLYLDNVRIRDRPPASLTGLWVQQRRWMSGAVQAFCEGIRFNRRFALVAGAYLGLLVNVAVSISAVLSPVIGPPSPATVVAASLLLNALSAPAALVVALEGMKQLGLRKAIKGLALVTALYNALAPYLLIDLVKAIARIRSRWRRTPKLGAKERRTTLECVYPLLFYLTAFTCAALFAPVLLPWTLSLLASTTAYLVLSLII